jgi:hypothetical protein
MNNSDVEKYSVLLCDALYTDLILWELRDHEKEIERGGDVEYHIKAIQQIKTNGVDNEFYLETGRKYYKLVHRDRHQRSVHCFIDKTTGDVLKPASWSAPAKGSRFNLLNDFSRKMCYNLCDWAGGYLYKRSDSCLFAP